MLAEATETEPYVLEFEISGLPSISANGSHGHWATKAKERKRWHALVAFAIGWRGPRVALNKAKLTLTRHSSSEPDFDGLVVSFKPVIDGLVRAKVIVNDKPSNIGQPQYRWEYSSPRKGFVTVRIEGN